MENKVAVIYNSFHHNNTEKLLESLKNVDLYNSEELNNNNFENYDYVGFASGIYNGTMSEKIKDIANTVELKKDVKVFVIYTCGSPVKNYAKSMEEIIEKRGFEYLGKFACKGYDTTGFFGKIGGISKNHPNEKDMEDCQNFLNQIIK